jgi:ribosome-associated protein YbcJ (S4-like RNA binding protein)
VIITKRKARKRKRIQHGSTIEYSEAVSQVAVEATVATKRLKKPRGSSS